MKHMHVTYDDLLKAAKFMLGKWKKADGILFNPNEPNTRRVLDIIAACEEVEE